jgi:hypothetical protein
MLNPIVYTATLRPSSPLGSLPTLSFIWIARTFRRVSIFHSRKPAGSSTKMSRRFPDPWNRHDLGLRSRAWMQRFLIRHRYTTTTTRFEHLTTALSFCPLPFLPPLPTRLLLPVLRLSCMLPALLFLAAPQEVHYSLVPSPIWKGSEPKIKDIPRYPASPSPLGQSLRPDCQCSVWELGLWTRIRKGLAWNRREWLIPVALPTLLSRLSRSPLQRLYQGRLRFPSLRGLLHLVTGIRDSHLPPRILHTFHPLIPLSQFLLMPQPYPHCHPLRLDG